MAGPLNLGFFILTSLLWIQEPPGSLDPVLVLPTDQTVLGAIADMDLLPNGNILVLDEQAHQILEFDREGALVRTLGRDGQGPGEIRGAVELEVAPDGQIWLLDFGNMRITRWDSGGALVGSSLLGEVLGQPVGWPHELVINDAGVFLKTSQFMPGEPVQVFRLHEDLRGIADTLVVVVPTPEASTCQFCPISVGPSGRVYGPKGDTAFVVSHVGRNGEQISALTVEGVGAVRRSEAELDRLRDAMNRLPMPEGGSVPEPDFSPFKSRFGRHAIGFDDHGRVWLAPRVAEGDPTVFYLFDSEGQFLTSLRAEDYLSGFKIRGSTLLAIGETEIGEPVLRVFEIR